MENEPMTPKEAGLLLRVSPRTVRNLISSGELVGRRVAGKYRTTRAACLAYIEYPPHTQEASAGDRDGGNQSQSPKETEYGTVISLRRQGKELGDLLVRGTKSKLRSSTTS